ncbi:MAG: hypothetical protein U0Y08_09490 [Bacteroidia bacterium]
MKRNKYTLILCSILLMVSGIIGCSKEETPENPYDSVDYSNTNGNDTTPDPASITGLHQNLFFPKCAVPGCHDGTFEPDFRTVQSTFSTMLYMTVNKRTLDSAKIFTYRVIPDDPDNSFLMERLTTTTSEYMPSNSVRLSSAEIANVRTWINNGCPDADGQLPQKPNLPPNILGYNAYTTTYVRLDTSRVDNIVYNPFIAPANITMLIPVLAYDTADGTNATLPEDFTVHQLKLSTDKNNFSAATTVNMTWLSPIPVGVWQATVNTANWPAGTTVFFRAYFNDGFQLNPAEFPRNQSLDYYKTYFAFKVQ